MKKILFLTLAASFLYFTSNAQGNNYRDKTNVVFNDLPVLQNTQIADSLLMWQEHIELHLDKTNVQPSDYVFFKAYVLTGPNRLRVSASEVLKVELLDETGHLIKSQYHKIEDGAADGSFKIPKRLKTGSYFFRTYTQWMLNYGIEELAKEKLLVKKGKSSTKLRSEKYGHLEAFPEGGHMVAGIKNRLVIKSAQEHISGLQIMDETGNLIAPVTSYGQLGTAIFEPKTGTSYYLTRDKQRVLKLSQVENTGYALQVNNLEIDKAIVRIETSPERTGIPMILKGLSDKITYFESKVDFRETSSTQVEISKEEIPSGVLDIVLTDEAGNVWAQRPIIIDKEQFRIALRNIESAEDGENEATFAVQVTDAEGRPVQTSLSVSLTGVEEGDEHPMKNSFNSEGDNNLRIKHFADDLSLLASNAISKITDQETNSVVKEIKYGFQKGLDFFGQAYDLNNQILRDTKIQIMIFPENGAIAEEVMTNSEGLFKLTGLDFNGEAKLVFRTAGKNTKEKLVKVIPYKNETPPLFIEEKTSAEANLAESEKDKKLSRKTAVDFLGKEEEGLINLEEVTLVANKSEKRFSPSVYGIEPSREIIQDRERPRTIPQLFLNVPGFNVADIGGLNPTLIIPRSAGMGAVLWVLDGFPIQQTNALRDIISIVPYPDIERIEILLGPSAAIYGTRAAAAAILIYTRNGQDEEYISRKHTELTYNGFHKSLDFGLYKEKTVPSLKKVKDNRPTIYWNPNLKTNANGEARIRLTVPETFKKAHLGIKAVDQRGKKANIETILAF